MPHHLAHLADAAASAAAPTATTTLGAVQPCAVDRAAEVRMFGDVEPEVRLRLELLARASASPETALPHVVALLVDGEARRAAIIDAVSTNEALREQWHRTWEALRR